METKAVEFSSGHRMYSGEPQSPLDLLPSELWDHILMILNSPQETIFFAHTCRIFRHLAINNNQLADNRIRATHALRIFERQRLNNHHRMDSRIENICAEEKINVFGLKVFCR